MEKPIGKVRMRSYGITHGQKKHLVTLIYGYSHIYSTKTGPLKILVFTI